MSSIPNIMGQFSPAALIQQLHNLPRLSRTGARASNTFSADLMTGTYMDGVLSVAAPYFALGVIFFVIFVLINLTFSCKRCCSKARESGMRPCCKDSACERCCTARVWFALPALVIVGLTAAALSQLTFFKGGLHDSLSAVDSFSGILTNSSALIQQDLSPELGSLIGSLQGLRAAAVANGFSAITGNIDATVGTLQTAQGTTNSSGSQLAGLANSLSSAIHVGSTSADKLESYVGYSAIGVCAAFLVWLLGVTATACCSRKGCAGIFRFCNGFVLLMLLLVFVFGGLFSLLGLVTADVCVAPSASVGSLVNATGAASTVSQSLVYYTTCGDAGASVAPAGAYALALDAQTQLTNAQNDITSLNAQLSGQAWAAPYLADINAEVAAADLTVQELLGYVGCAPVYNVWTRLTESLCNKGVLGIAVTWALASAACPLFFVLVIAATRLCGRHPADAHSAPDAAAAKSALQTGGGIYLGSAAGAPSTYLQSSSRV